MRYCVTAHDAALNRQFRNSQFISVTTTLFFWAVAGIAAGLLVSILIGGSLMLRHRHTASTASAGGAQRAGNEAAKLCEKNSIYHNRAAS